MSRILIVKNYGIGNQVLVTPLLTALKQLGHDILVVSEYTGIEVLKGNANIGGLIQWYPGYDDYENNIKLYIEHRFKPELAIASVPVHGNSGDKFLKTARNVLNYGKVEKWTKHEADINLDYARELGWKGDWLPTEIYIPDDLEEGVENIYNEMNRPKIVGVHFGCIKNTTWIYKRWHLERFMEVAWKLHNKTGCHILLTGGQMERDEADQFYYSTDESIRPYIIDTVNKCNIMQSAAWIRRCNVFISNDSGPMHISSAVGTPVVAIFGMSNPIKNGPWAKEDMYTIIKKDLWCQPCFGTQLHGACQRGDCLAEITVDEVYEASLSYIKD